jgi:hypothetical protein
VQEKYLRGVLGVDRETPAYIVREECKRNNRLIGKESDKVWRKNGRKGRVQSTNRMLERKEKTRRRRRERHIIRETGISMKWSGESKRKMDAAKLSEREKGTDKQERRGKYRCNRKYEGVWQRKFRSTWGREIEEEERRCTMCYEERDNWAHVEWKGERERKEKWEKYRMKTEGRWDGWKRYEKGEKG